MTLVAPKTVAWPAPIELALRRPSGARFYKAALQVNPFQYLLDERKATTFTDEDSYNDAIVNACLANGIEIIGLADHHRVRTGDRLAAVARAAGIAVFPGFEAATKDGVHVLCLFDPAQSSEEIDRILGLCGILKNADPEQVMKYDLVDLVEQSRTWDAVCVAAHATLKGGIFALKGQPRMNAWRAPELLACAIPGPVRDVPDEMRRIILNETAEYRREHPIAVLNARDVCDPSDFASPGASTFIKMSEVSVDGLRQAFLDPGSRILLNSDASPEEHVEFVALAWEGGFLDGTALHLNENLNVLIGGRGAGKSTVIESVRYVLDIEPVGEEARALHQAIVKKVLKGGTKISLLVRAHRPAAREYLIERTVDGAPSVRQRSGEAMSIAPRDLVPGAEVYGQHEISELTKSPEKLTQLLRRFIQPDADQVQRRMELARDLAANRRAFLENQRDTTAAEESLAELPVLKETLRRFDEADLQVKLKERSDLVKEEERLRLLAGLPARVRKVAGEVRETLFDAAAETDFDGLPNKDLLMEAREVLSVASATVAERLDGIEVSLAEADRRLADVRARWDERKRPGEERYEAMLRDLQRSKVDGNEYMRTQKKIEQLRPVEAALAQLRGQADKLREQRRELLRDWDEVRAEDFRATAEAAKRVNGMLAGRVRVTVTIAGDRTRLVALLNEHLEGRRNETVAALSGRDDLSLTQLAEVIRQGKDAVVAAYKLPALQAEKLAKLAPEIILEIEELDLPPTTQLELNTAATGKPVSWRPLHQLSTGQKATTVLLLLLLQSDAPLVLDQPEDDLDNRFISEEIVPRMRSEKGRRQFLFSTHNANIPVLADAELILGMSATGDAVEAGGTVREEHMGSIDGAPIRNLVEEILEGGRDAFLKRKKKYGF